MKWNGLWAVYTAHKHTRDEGESYLEKINAVGIVAGGAPCDHGYAHNTARRERDFPTDRIMKGLDTTIQTANASHPQDKKP